MESGFSLVEPGGLGDECENGGAAHRRSDLVGEAKDGLTAILAEVAKSSYLRGTVVKALKEAVRRVEGAFDSLNKESAAQAARRLEAENRLLSEELSVLRAEVRALKAALPPPAKRSTAPPPQCSSLVSREMRDMVDALKSELIATAGGW